MLTRVQEWSESEGVRFPLEILEEAKIGVGDEVHVNVEHGRIIVEPAPGTRRKYLLEDLVARIPEDCVPEEEDWGNPVGREMW